MESITFGQWIKKLRAQHELTQERLAERVGCATSTLRSFEQGARRPSREMSERIADVLEVPSEQRKEFLRSARQLLDDSSKNRQRNEASLSAQQSPKATPPRSKLPPTGGPLIGRQAEQDALQQMLLEDRQRVVTLLGAGGVGKTRLAIEVAQRVADQFSQGAAFIALAPLQSPLHFAWALAAAASISTPGIQSLDDAVVSWLMDKEILLVLDNFEHLLSDSAAIRWLRGLLQSAPRLQLLITSRERLRINGERIFEVGGLGQGTSRGRAIDKATAPLLFVERAKQAAGGFVLDANNQLAVANLCNLAEGLPLAIELLAARVNDLSPQQIADEFTHTLDSLPPAERDLPPHQRSMRAALDVSWKSLSAEEQAILMKLSIFHGGCTLQSATTIADASLPVLNSLIDKSLLSYSAVAIGGDDSQGRYLLHEVIRHFAAEHLQGQPFANELDARFAAYFVAQVEATDRQLYIDDPTQWRLRIGAELDNVRSILQRSLTAQHDPDLGLRMASLMGPHWCVAELWKEGCEWINSALTLSKAEGAIRAHALTALGELHHLLGEQSRAEGILQDALRRWRALGNADRTAWTLLQLGKVTATYAVNGTADSYLSESLAIYRQLGNRAQVVALLNQMSAVSIQRGDYARAEQVLSELLPIERAAGLPRPIGVVLNYLGRAILDQGDAARALPLLVESLSIFDSERADWGISWTLINLGLAERALGNWAKSASYYWRAFQVYRGLDQLGGMRAACEGLASLAVEIGDFEKSVSLLAAAEKLYRQSGQPLTSYEIKIQQQTFNRTQAALSEPAWKQAWQAGEILTIEQLVALIETLRFAEQ